LRIMALMLQLAVGIALYIFGGLSDRHSIFPMQQIIALREQFLPVAPPPESRFTFDSQGRLIGEEGRASVSCPPQTNRSVVLLVLGQSNAANYAGQRYRSKFGPRIVNFLDGQCFVARSPLLGSTGT
jgi:hypothetical protein